MDDVGAIGLILLLANIAFSYKGFNDGYFFDKYKFEVDKILIFKDYKRLVTSGFLHVSWTHLIFNMISLLAFSGIIEDYLGPYKFLLIYLGSLIGGNLLSLLIHRQHGDYSSVGASGAICGVIFASIALFPGIGIGFFILPMSIPGWLYGLGYVIFSIYGIKSKKDNIGHEAHLGGALIGMVIAILFSPYSLIENYLTISIITIPTLVFIYLIVTKPHILLIDNYFYNHQEHFYSIDHKYNADKKNKQQEIDFILDKIGKKGMDSLSKSEKKKLDDYSR